MSNIGFLILNIYALIILVVLCFVFFSKERQHKIEDIMYSKLLISSLITISFGLVLGCLLDTSIAFRDVLIVLTNKVYLIGLIVTISMFAFYTFCISHKNSKFFSTIQLIYKCSCYINGIVIALLPLYVEDVNGSASTSGPAMEYTYLIFALIYVLLFLLLILDHKNIKNKKYIPIIVLIIEGVIVTIIQMINPSLNYIVNPSTVITCLIMYFTIENPDMKLIKELYDNRKYIQKSNEDTSRFLFRVTQDIKKPVKDIIEATASVNSSNTKEELIETKKYINNQANQIDHLINKALNISSMDTQTIKIFNNRYNIINLIKEISYKFDALTKEEVKYTYNISGSIPEYLYGDSIKLKQAITSLLNRSNETTDKGFINLDVSFILKYNVCRLIISVEDSGKYITIDKINEILSTNPEEVRSNNELEGNTLDILSIKKIINMLGGSLMIKSEEEEGTTVTITLDQKVVETEKTELSKKLDAYENSLQNDKKILVIDDDEVELTKIERYFTGEGAYVNSSLYGKDVIEKMRAKYKYDLIILDDDLGNVSALTILKELKKDEKFNIPVVVMINDNKEKIKLEYLKDGFFDTISKSKLDSELARIIKRI